MVLMVQVMLLLVGGHFEVCHSFPEYPILVQLHIEHPHTQHLDHIGLTCSHEMNKLHQLWILCVHDSFQF